MPAVIKPTSVLVVGAGITGPAIALLLKQRGYRPVVVEKVRDLGDVGIAISLHPNGVKVLAAAGVADSLILGPPSTPETLRWDEFSSTGEFLGGPGSGLLTGFVEKYGWPVIGVTRTRLQTLLMDTCRERGIPVHTGWRLVDLEEVDDGIIARSEDGREIRADFIIGADGLKSRTREKLLQRRGVEIKDPEYTGVAVIGGQAPTPKSLLDVPAIRIWYGETFAIISHTLEDNSSVWGVTYADATPVRESWRTIPHDELQKEVEVLLEKCEGWDEPVLELLKGTRKMMHIGLYDRPELPVEQWYWGRGVLIGDAAHPTTPHVGQGANQGLEDAWHLSQLLPLCDDASTNTFSSSDFEAVFHSLAARRQEPTAMIVKRAREQGNIRVVTDKSPDAWKKRNDRVRKVWNDVGVLQTMYDALYKQPFEDKGGYTKMIQQSQHS